MAFVKIDKNIVNWEWFKDANTLTVWMYCLTQANWKPGRFMGHEIPRGSFATSVQHIAADCGLTSRNVRTSLEKLKNSENLTIKTTNKFSLISVINYAKYQDKTDETDKQSDKRLTNDRQTTDKQTDNNRRSKEVKNIRSKEKRVWGSFSHVKLEDSELESLKEQFGEDHTLAKIEYLDSYIEERGYRSNNHFVTLQKWMTEDDQKKSKGSHGSNKVQKLKTPPYYDDDTGKVKEFNQDKASPEQIAELDALLRKRKEKS